jgi:lipopolysaccharide/colanic/teichoic acid biosynthesis glycosyltransferase
MNIDSPTADPLQAEFLPALGTPGYPQSATGRTLSEQASRSWARLSNVSLKRAFDLFVAVTALVFLAPVFAVVAVLIRLDGKQVFFGHKRIGQFGRGFHCLKFRTMVPDAERALRELLENDPAAAAEWAETQKLRRDPRVTKIGRFLRMTSLDELPQLINIVRGDMSLVGPRPIVAAEMSRYGDQIGYYLSVQPGLTGPWQIGGRSDVSYKRRVEMDTQYVRTRTFAKDLAILLKTVPAVIASRGAL